MRSRLCVLELRSQRELHRLQGCAGPSLPATSARCAQSPVPPTLPLTPPCLACAGVVHAAPSSQDVVFSGDAMIAENGTLLARSEPFRRLWIVLSLSSYFRLLCQLCRPHHCAASLRSERTVRTRALCGSRR